MLNVKEVSLDKQKKNLKYKQDTKRNAKTKTLIMISYACFGKLFFKYSIALATAGCGVGRWSPSGWKPLSSAK